MLSVAGMKELSAGLEAAAAVGCDQELPREQRRRRGVFFTPQPLVDFVVETALSAWWREPPPLRGDGSPEMTVLDPSAGDGRFLRAAARAIAARLVDEGPARARMERLVLERCSIGIERDPALAERARSDLGGARVHCDEALCGASVEDGSVDLVVGNPPYLRSLRFTGDDRALRDGLRGAYAATSHGEWDLYAPFIEQSLRWVNHSGVVGLVVPSRWWTAAWAEPLRALLAERRAVRALVDFGAEQVFPGATTYASVVFLSATGSESVAVARSRGGAWSTGTVASADIGRAPWSLLYGPARELSRRLQERSTPLGEVARIAKGTGTNADRVYVFRPGDVDIEDELTRPVIRGRDVVPFGGESPAMRCLIPYDSTGALIEPSALAGRYPRARRYLESQRAILEARESGRFAGDRYYCFGRPQNLVFHLDREPKIVIPDVAREGRAMLDRRGCLVLDSAYAIRLRASGGPYSLEELLAVLGSRAIRLWLRDRGAVLRGGYLRLKTRYLQGFPLPPPGPALARAGQLAAGRSPDPGEVDEAVRLAYGVGSDLWRRNSA